MTYNNKDLAQLWAQQTVKEAKGSNFFFEGRTIYSYGYHFPIARIDPENKVVTITIATYSVSTARHKSLVRQAIPKGYTIIEVHPDDL